MRLSIGIVVLACVLTGCVSPVSDPDVAAIQTGAAATVITALTTTPLSSETGSRWPYSVTGNANLRAGPGTEFAIVGGLRAGDTFAIEGRNSAGDWFQIQTPGGLMAWLAAFLVAAPPPATEVALAADIPTPAPVPTSPPPAAAATRLNVQFVNPHYNCDRGQGENDFFRQFQIDMFIENTTGETLVSRCDDSSRDYAGCWVPSRWIITGNGQARASTEKLWFTSEQKDIPPGGSIIGTAFSMRVEMWEWVQAVEWDYDGQTYRQEFVDNALNRTEYHYVDCPLR